MIEVFHGLTNKVLNPLYNSNGTLKGINWEPATSPEGGLVVTNNVLTQINTDAYYGAFGPILPQESFYFDITTTKVVGYHGPSGTDGFSFIGICNNLSAINWNKNFSNPNTLTWYSDMKFGGGGTPSGPLTFLIAGKYRFAFNFDTKRFYMVRISPEQSQPVWVDAPTFTGDLRIFFCARGDGYLGPKTITINEIGLGSGGLY